MPVRILTSSGAYNWAKPSEIQFQVSIHVVNVPGVPNRTLSETFKEDPEVEGKSISDVLNIIEERVNSFWIRTDREEQLAKIEFLRNHVRILTIEWVKDRIEVLRKEIKDRFSEIEDLRIDYDFNE